MGRRKGRLILKGLRKTGELCKEEMEKGVRRRKGEIVGM